MRKHGSEYRKDLEVNHDQMGILKTQGPAPMTALDTESVKPFGAVNNTGIGHVFCMNLLITQCATCN